MVEHLLLGCPAETDPMLDALLDPHQLDMGEVTSGTAHARPSDHGIAPRSGIMDKLECRRRSLGGSSAAAVCSVAALAKDLTQERFPEISGLTQSAGSSEVAAIRR